MSKDNEPQTNHATPAAKTAAALWDIIEDPATPEVVKLALVATLRGMASKVAEAILDKPGREARAKSVSEEQTLLHLPRWIATAEREGLRPREGAVLPFERAA